MGILQFGPQELFPGEIKTLPAINWTNQLNGGMITASSWILPSGATMIASSFTDTHALVRIQVAEFRGKCAVQNHVVLSDGQERIAEIVLLSARSKVCS